MLFKKVTHSGIEFSYAEALGEQIVGQIQAIMDAILEEKKVESITSFAALYYALYTLNGAEYRGRAEKYLDSFRDSYRLANVEYAWLVKQLSPEFVHFDNVICTTPVGEFSELITSSVRME